MTTISVEDQYYIEAASVLGAEHGRAAGTWVIDGNTTEDTARTILTGINDGDPEFYDSIPAPLSGEFADGETPATILNAIGLDGGDDLADEALNTYEDAYRSAYETEVVRSAQAVVQ
jgi:hypothetical protein